MLEIALVFMELPLLFDEVPLYFTLWAKKKCNIYLRNLTFSKC